jgi:hypothetical protein
MVIMIIGFYLITFVHNLMNKKLTYPFTLVVASEASGEFFAPTYRAISSRP